MHKTTAKWFDKCYNMNENRNYFQVSLLQKDIDISCLLSSIFARISICNSTQERTMAGGRNRMFLRLWRKKLKQKQQWAWEAVQWVVFAHSSSELCNDVFLHWTSKRNSLIRKLSFPVIAVCIHMWICRHDEVFQIHWQRFCIDTEDAGSCKSDVQVALDL